MRIDQYEIDILKFLPRWVKDHRVFGREANATCPFSRHRSGNWKFYINLDTGLWNCQACGDKKGNFRQLIALMEDLGRDEVNDFIRRNGREIDLEDFDERIMELLYGDDEPLRMRSIKYLRKETTRVIGEKSSFLGGQKNGYWRRRGFRRSTIQFWNLRIQSGGSVRPYIIPITVDGLPYFHVRRARDEGGARPKYLFQRGFPRREVLFGLDRAESNRLVLCEGPLDCIAVWQSLNYHGLLEEYSPVAVFGDRVLT